MLRKHKEGNRVTNEPSPPAQTQQLASPDQEFTPAATSLLDLVPQPLLHVTPRYAARVTVALEDWCACANVAWKQLCGTLPGDDTSVADWLALTYTDAAYRAEVGTTFQAALRRGLAGPSTRYELSTQIRIASGERRWLEIVAEIGPASRSGFVVMLREPQTRQNRPADPAPLPSIGDPLSGLPDEHTALDRIDMEWNRFKRSGIPFSLVLCEIDRLDAVERDLGTPTAEFAVRQIAATLRNTSRVVDAVTRWGEHGFLLIASATPDREAATLAERLRRAVEALDCNWYGHPLALTISASYAGIREGQAWQSLLDETITGLATGRLARLNSVHGNTG